MGLLKDSSKNGPNLINALTIAEEVGIKVSCFFLDMLFTLNHHQIATSLILKQVR